MLLILFDEYLLTRIFFPKFINIISVNFELIIIAMRIMRNNSLVALAFTMLLLIPACKKGVPELTTVPVNNITGTTAESGGVIISDGGSDISSYGLCWDTSSNPTTANNTITDSALVEQFTLPVKGLLPVKTYHIRAFAVNESGTGYGDELTFTTPPSVPVIKTSEISELSFNSARSGGIIISDGGSTILNAGVCWDTAPNPVMTGSKSSVTPGTSEFSADVAGLRSNTTYYIRAYATNDLGTAYGEEIKFMTPKRVPLVITASVTDTELFSAVCSFSLTSDGGSRIKEYGICWSTSPDPTTSDLKSSKPFTRGKFRMTDLKPGTTYFVRSYAINSEGTGYGKTLSFTTLGTPPSVRTLSTSEITTSGAIVKAAVNAGLLPTETVFEYGVNENYGQSAKSDPQIVQGKSETTITARLTDLKPGTTYHLRAKATNALGTSFTSDTTFIVLMPPTLTGFSPVNKNYHDKEFIIAPPSSNSPGSITYSSNNPKVLVIEGNRGRITGSGTATISAAQAPSGIFTGGTVTTTFSMNVVDIDGNVYNTIAIGDQDWMKENLKVTRYRNGEPIPNVTDDDTWVGLTTGAYCWINNDSVTGRTGAYARHGALYNWYAVVDGRRICPTGWHVPTDAEWQVMEREIGMTFAEADGTVDRGENYGTMLKDSTGWVNKGKGTNTTEFSALPGGLRFATSGEFFNVGIDACWWTATEEDSFNAWLRNMYTTLTSIYRIPDSKNFGFSVRCVRDRRR